MVDTNLSIPGKGLRGSSACSTGNMCSHDERDEKTRASRCLHAFALLRALQPTRLDPTRKLVAREPLLAHI